MMTLPHLDRFAPISLTQLNATADLQRRVDRKYLVPAPELSAMLATLIADCAVLDIDRTRCFGYRSVYFDDLEHSSFRGAATGRRQRFKVRTRTYLDSGLCMAEVKVRGPRGQNVKLRQAHPGECATNLQPARDFITHSLEGRSGADQLRPVLRTTYDRTTFLHFGDNSRITVDTNLVAASLRGVQTVALPDLAVVETKSAGAITNIDRWLWANGHRPAKVSKYATMMAMLEPSLPQNRWHRTVERITPYAIHSDRIRGSFVSAAELKRRNFVLV